MSSVPNDTIKSATSSRTSTATGKPGYLDRYDSSSARAASANAVAVMLLAVIGCGSIRASSE